MDIKFETVGKIVAGEDSGQYVKVIDDRTESGGFLILTAKSPNMQGGYDNWVESEVMLRRFFEESDWVIDWSS